MPENRLMGMAGGLDVSSYPTAGSGNKLLPPPDMMQGASQAIGVAQQFQNLTTSQFELAGKQLGALQNIYSSIVSNPTQENIMRRSLEASQMGIDSKTIANGLAEFGAAIGRAGNDPARIKEEISQVALNHLSSIAPVAERLQLAGRGAPTFHNNGKEDVPVVTRSGMSPAILPAGGGAMPRKLSPGERTQVQPEIDPRTGARRDVSVGTRFDDYGDVRGAAPMPPSRPSTGPQRDFTSRVGGVPQNTTAPPPSPPGGQETRYDVRGASSPAPTTSAIPAPVSAAPAAPAGPATVQSSVGFPTAMSPTMAADRESSTKQFTTDREDIPASRQRLFVLEQANQALRGTDTGKGTEARNRMLQFIAALPGGLPKWIAGDPEKLSNYDLARKFTAAVQMTQQGAGRSDAALATSGAANPNVEMNPAAAKSVLADLIGQEKLKQARIRHYVGSKADPGGYAEHVTMEWDHDPRAYGLSALEPRERTEMFKKMSEGERKRFRDSVRAGFRSGALRAEDIAGSAGDQ